MNINSTLELLNDILPRILNGSFSFVSLTLTDAELLMKGGE
jgi:hypothetical protein